MWPFAALRGDDHRSLFFETTFPEPSHLATRSIVLYFHDTVKFYAIRTVGYLIDVMVLYVFCDKNSVIVLCVLIGK